MDFSFPELNSDQGTQTADYLRNSANAAADAVCNLYQQYPSGIIPSLGDPTGIGAFTDGLLNRLCGPRGKTPPPPSSPFNGGQCVCVNYLVQWTLNFPGEAPSNGQTTKTGPIGGIEKRRNPGATLDTIGFQYGAPECANGFYGIITTGVDASVVINSVTRVDGNPDTCGSLPPTYPKVDVPPNVYSPTFNIGRPGGVVSVPVTIIPTLIKPSVEFRPEINVKVGPVNVNFNLGGVDLSIDNSGGVDITLPSGDSRPLPPSPTSPKEPRPQPCDLTEVKKKLDEIKACACKKKKVLRNVVYGKAKGRTVSLPPDTQYCVLSGSPTSGVKYQVSEGTAPDIFYMGWASWGVGSAGGERIPLNFVSAGFESPKNATTFSYSLVYNSEASLTVYFLEDEP